MNEKAEPKTVGLRLLNLDKKFVEPYTIQDKFVSIVAFHHAERVVSLPGGGTKSFAERVPLYIAWDGKEIKYGMAETGQEIEMCEEKFVLDRAIDESPNLPSNKFVMEITQKDSKMLENFNPKDYFNAIHDYFEYYFYLPHPMLYKIVSLFVASTMTYDAHDATPYLYIRSPDKNCGKSHLGQSVINMVNGMMLTNMKAHHVFRMLHGTKMILGLDEIKGWTGKGAQDKEVTDILSLFNVGFQRGGSKVPRLEEKKGGRKGEMQIVLYDSYAPKVLITTHMTLPEDTLSRCIEIMMQRAGSAGGDINYDERWDESERTEKLEKIREMGYLFRLKYGSDIKSIGANKDWHQCLDIKGIFANVRNRELQIFRPLIIQCLKFIPEWQDDVAKYITKNIEMRSQLEHTPTVAILYALREIWQKIEGGGTVDDAYIENIPGEGAVLIVPASTIEYQIKSISDSVYLGTHATSTIGRVLRDLGFLQAKRKSGHICRYIKGTQLADRCLRYLGKPIGNEQPGGGLSQQEKMNLIRDILILPDIKKNGIMFDQLLFQLNGRLTDGELRAYLNNLRTQGYITVGRDGKIGGSGDIKWFD